LVNNSTIFPPVEQADEDGLLAISRNLDSRMLAHAYTSGIFPWPVDEQYILWFAPPQRAILNLDTMNLSRSLRRDFKNRGFEFRINSAFDEVIRNCSRRIDGEDTWIIPKMIEAYRDFHKKGFAFSFETYNIEGVLVGGLYGIWINRYFAGESMFYRESGASKFALVNTLEFLRDQAGLKWIDTQMRTPLFERIGAVDISRRRFMHMLKEELNRPVPAEVEHYQLEQRKYL